MKFTVLPLAFLSAISTVFANDNESNKTAPTLASLVEARDNLKPSDERFLKERNKNFWLGSLKLQAKAGLTNTSGSVATDDELPVDLRSEEFVRSVEFGWIKKPLFRDILLTGDAHGKGIEVYRSNKGRPYRVFFLDAVMVTAKVGYGSTLTNEKASSEITTEDKSNYYVGISYEVSFEKLGSPFQE